MIAIKIVHVPPTNQMAARWKVSTPKVTRHYSTQRTIVEAANQYVEQFLPLIEMDDFILHFSELDCTTTVVTFVPKA